MVKVHLPGGETPPGRLPKKEEKILKKVLTNPVPCYIIHKLSDS